jgi:hypothetical protein
MKLCAKSRQNPIKGFISCIGMRVARRGASRNSEVPRIDRNYSINTKFNGRASLYIVADMKKTKADWEGMSQLEILPL